MRLSGPRCDYLPTIEDVHPILNATIYDKRYRDIDKTAGRVYNQYSRDIDGIGSALKTTRKRQGLVSDLGR
jgi:hypothetical protein